MPRLSRVDFPGAHHHVYNRATHDGEVLSDDEDRAAFLSLLAELRPRFGVEVHAFALGDGEYHLLLRSLRGQLSGAIQYLQSAHSRNWNHRHGTDGQRFRGRFGSRRIDDTAYWRTVAASLHLLPVAQGRAVHPDRGRWTSHHVYAGHASPPSWLATEELHAAFDEAGGYRVVLDRHARTLGSLAFQATLDTSTNGPRATVMGTGSALPADQPLMSPREALRQAARVTGMPMRKLLTARIGRSGNPERWVAMWWLGEAAGLSKSEIARMANTSVPTVSRSCARVLKATDGAVWRWREQLADTRRGAWAGDLAAAK